MSDKQSVNTKIRRNDIFLIIGIVLVISVISLIYFCTRKEGSYAVIIKNGVQTAKYSLNDDLTVPIKNGNTVTNVLVIKDGEADITEAICPDQICVEHSAVSKVGETIVCLPEELVIKIIASNSKDAPDMVV